MPVPAPLRSPALLLAAGALAACGGQRDAAPQDSSAAAAGPAGADSASARGRPVAQVTGLRGPEAVRYDADQDVYFVSSWDGDPTVLDNNGFISRVRPDGTVDSLRFVAGGARGVTLHAPRGMAIVGDTLWVADADAVRGFNRRTGAAVGAVTFAGERLGFLNDVAAGPDGALHVTDTGTNRVYRVTGRRAAVAIASDSLGGPNGITWDAAASRFLVVPFGGGHEMRAFAPGAATLAAAGTVNAAQLDGVEVLAGGGVLVASQSDSSLHLVRGGRDEVLVRLPGKPADIGVDTRRNRVAVPYVALDRVDIYDLPAAGPAR